MAGFLDAEADAGGMAAVTADEKGLHGLAGGHDVFHDVFVGEFGIAAIRLVAHQEHAAHVGVFGQAGDDPGHGLTVITAAPVFVGAHIQARAAHGAGDHIGQCRDVAGDAHHKDMVADAHFAVFAYESPEFHASPPSCRRGRGYLRHCGYGRTVQVRYLVMRHR